MVSVYVVAASDAEKDEARRLRWGDYWFKRSLGDALTGLGHNVTGNVAEADVVINCHGLGIERLPAYTFNVLWVIGHPDRLHVEECEQYDAVFSESAAFAEHLRQHGIACGHLPGASDFVPLDVPIEHDTVFVGNARGSGRPCIDALGDLGPWVGRLEVWGEGWGRLPKGIWRGESFPHEDLNRLYASSKTLLNDAHPDMDEWGFTNPREYDIRAVRGETVPTFPECAARLMASVPERRLMLDLGAGGQRLRGFISIDRAPDDDSIVRHDLEDGLPEEYASVDVIMADNVLEHINNLVPLLNDCHAALKPTGRMHVVVPNAIASPEAAFSDPTHVRYFTPETWNYFDGDNQRWREYGRRYGILPWRIVFVRQRERFIDVMLRPGSAVAQGNGVAAGPVTTAAGYIANSRAYGNVDSMRIV